MNNHYELKRKYFDKGSTRSYEFRLDKLERLKNAIEKYEGEIINALRLDLNKPPFEAYTSEIMIVYEEIRFAMKNLKKWMKPRPVKTPVYLQPSKSYILPEPKGVVLIISPWNYPFQLCLAPLVGAIAAGNCIMLKPSFQSRETSKIIQRIVDKIFPNEYISLIEGKGSTVSPIIQNHRFDHIFFTGSKEVAKGILQLVAKDLVPTTLELGGKSPVIVHSDADLDLAAKRITWAKLYNCGQTCVAPDYLLVHESIRDDLIKRIEEYTCKFYGNDPKKSPDYGRIINEKNFNRLTFLLENSSIIYGGQVDLKDRYIGPTLVEVNERDIPIMREEIFGPILPILKYSDIEDSLGIISENPYPLALYVFTKDRKIESFLLDNIQFGGGCINHSISQVANSHLPFGGIGYSGMGKYHHKYSFDTFSNEKSILKAYSIDANIIYPPYSNKLLAWIKRIF